MSAWKNQPRRSGGSTPWKVNFNAMIAGSFTPLYQFISVLSYFKHPLCLLTGLFFVAEPRKGDFIGVVIDVNVKHIFLIE